MSNKKNHKEIVDALSASTDQLKSNLDNAIANLTKVRSGLVDRVDAVEALCANLAKCISAQDEVFIITNNIILLLLEKMNYLDNRIGALEQKNLDPFSKTGNLN